MLRRREDVMIAVASASRDTVAESALDKLLRLSRFSPLEISEPENSKKFILGSCNASSEPGYLEMASR